MKIGKLNNKMLEEIIFSNIKCRRPEVLERPGVGKDCAIIDFDSYDCVLSTDPITAAIGEIGRLAIHISCNDIATTGIEPLGIMLAVMLPEGTTEEQVETMMKQAGEEAAKLNVEIIGGHTEITNAVIKPVIVSTAIGRAPKGSGKSAEPIKVGDGILLTKFAGIEGTGIIAGDFEGQLTIFLTQEELTMAKAMLMDISVVREGVIAGRHSFKAMHDVTEGGVLGAVWEICEVAGTGADIIKEAIPVKDVTKKICSHYGIDYLKLISSGCMLIILGQEEEEQLIAELEAANIPVALIGRITDKGRYLLDHGVRTEIAMPDSDELYKVVDNLWTVLEKEKLSTK